MNKKITGLLVAMSAILPIACAQAATMSGPFVLQGIGPEAAGVLYGVTSRDDGGTYAAVFIPGPDASPAVAYDWHKLEDLLSHSALEHITIPSVGERGVVANARGECLVPTSGFIFKTLWVPCTAAADLVWFHREGGRLEGMSGPNVMKLDYLREWKNDGYLRAFDHNSLPSIMLRTDLFQ